MLLQLSQKIKSGRLVEDAESISWDLSNDFLNLLTTKGTYRGQ